MFQVDDPVSVIKNIWCKTKRGAAFVVLEVAVCAVRLAETAIGAAQVVVDKARVVEDGADMALTIIEKRIEQIKYVINGLEAVENLINYGVDLAKLIMEAVSEDVIDVRDCGLTEFVYSKDILESGMCIILK
ncbi:hypothetical protein DPMN_060109 [Dreissena polymorpha]|uniref:Uncharacterized protein n=1 Tax=Dreissena polymorpha TaxID=45954 RepID=A0A9D4C4L9_DREPO|nr:hypothetical protein DPMN_060109 [Dreissena polymorpha]